MTPEQREELKAAAQEASPGPWTGDRYDGTVKYQLLDANDNAVIKGDNGNSGDGGYGITNYEDEVYLKAANPSAILSLIAQVEALTVDAERWQFLVSIMESAKGSAHLTVNQHLAYYETCEPGEEVSLQWYPDTPIGSYNIEGFSITQVVDEARSEFAAPTIPAIPGTKEGA